MENAEQREVIFTVHLAPSIRNFKGQSSGATCDPVTINANSVEHFKSCVIDFVAPLVSREIVFGSDMTPSWSPSTSPSREDIGRFVLFYPPSKRVVELNALSTQTLQNWFNKTISMFIHKYSNSVSSKSLWIAVEKALIAPAERDRAGAASMASLLALKGRLKELHQDAYQSQDINWQIWANFIQSKDAHLQQSLETQAPPPHLIHLFAHAPSVPEVQMANVHRGLDVAFSINENFAQAILQLKSTVQILKRKHEEMEEIQKVVDSELQALENMSGINSNLLDGFGTAIGTMTTEYGQSLLHEIEDMPDTDHA